MLFPYLFLMCLPIIASDFTDGNVKAVLKCSNDRVLWKTEDKKCQEENKGFHCLEAVDSGVRYVRMCAVPILIHKGNYPVYNGKTKKIEPRSCSAETYQEHEAYSNESLFFKCLSSKTPFYSEGQLECGEPSTVEDRMFTCDFKNYYRFEDPNMNQPPSCYPGLGSFCIKVSERECNRTTHQLNAGFVCVPKCEDGGMRADEPPYSCMGSKYPTEAMKTEHSTKSVPVTKPKVPENKPDNGVPSPGEIVAIVVCALIFIFGLVIGCKYRQKISDVHEEREQPQEKKQFKQGDIVLVRVKGCPVWWPGKVIGEDYDKCTYTAYILSDKSEFIIHQQDTLAFNESIVEKSLETLKKKNMKMTLNSFLEDIKLLKGLEFPKEQSTSLQPQTDAHPMEEDKPSEDENEYQNSSGSEYHPDSSEERDSGQSIEEDKEAFITKEDRVKCSELDDVTGSDVFPMLLEKTTVMLKEKKLDTRTKEVDENETDDEDLDKDKILRDQNNKELYIKKVFKSSTTKTGKCLEFPKEQSTSLQPQTDAHPMEEDKPSEDENEYQNSSGSEYHPDSSEESDSGQSIEDTKEHRVECSESEDDTGSDVFPMLLEKTTVLLKERKLDTRTKEVDENETDDEDLDEDQILRDKNNKELYIKKVSKSSTTKTGKCKKFDRVYNSYQYCGICRIMVSNFAQHLERNRKRHASSQELNDIWNEKDKKRKSYLRTLLRAKFNHKFNMKNIRRGKGEILLERRPTGSFDVNDYGPCPKCFLWIAKRLMLKHQRFCVVCDVNEQTKVSSAMLLTQSDILTKRLQPEASKSLVKEVFMIMNNDKVGEIVRNDPLITQLGNVWMEKNVDNKLKRGSYTSQIIRLVGRMLMNLRNLKPLNIEAGLWDYLKPENFDAIAEATLLTAVPSNDDEENLLKPSNAIKLGYDIKRLLNFKVGMSIMQNDTKSRQDAENLLKTMNIFWGTKVTKLARVLLERRKYSKKNELPLPQDIQKLTEYLKKSISEFDLTQTDAATFQHVAEIVSARLLTYNRRRTGELQAISYENRRTAGSEITEHVLGDCTEFEKRLLTSQQLMTVRGKTGRGVPVLVPEDCSAGLTYLTKVEVRKAAGLPVSNHYIFANHDSVVRAYDSLAKACRYADLLAPERITSTNLRKYMATMTQVLDLKEQEMNWVLNHLGHTLDVHQIHYRCTSEALEKTQIAKILLLQDCDLIGRFRNKTLQDIQLTDLISRDDNPAVTGPLPQDEDQIEFVLDMAEKLEEVEENMPKKKRMCGTKNRRQGWSLEEEEEITSLFKVFLEETKRPKPAEIMKKMNKSKQNNGLIFKRKKDDLKKKVFRMVDKIKRKK